jgi:hypothetical protein
MASGHTARWSFRAESPCSSRGEAAGFYIKRRENVKPLLSREQMAARLLEIFRTAAERRDLSLACGSDVDLEPNKAIS